MALYSAIATMIKRVVVDLASATPQLLHAGGSVLPDVEYMEPQGLHFRAPKDAQGLALSPGAVVSGAVAINLSGVVPTNSLQPGEGGLHYLGEWRVYLAADGTVHLGVKDPGDYVALASKVDSELSKIKTDLDNIKTTFDAHTHVTTATIGAGPTVGVNSPPAGPIPVPHTPASVKSTVVRSK